jgi:arabinofuranosyltransferase
MLSSRSRMQWLTTAMVASALLAFAVVLVRTAWVNEDAYITFRTIDNWLNGYGLRWNINERVQAFTNPLWMFLMSAVVFVTREYFFTAIVSSMVVSLAAVGLVAFRIARSTGLALLAVAALLSSRAFVDYSTSGLENPLTHVLLAAFALLLFRLQWPPKVLFMMSCTAALAMLNRMDTILFFAPALVYVWLSERTLRATLIMAAGFLPFVLWEGFSLVYYGFLVPNTAFAKLGSGIDNGLMLWQGLYYYAYTLRNDPITLPIIALGVAAAFAARRGREIALALGVLLYLAYIIKIGGDFMGGRFFAAPLFAAVMLAARAGRFASAWRAIPAAALVIWVCTWAPNPPFLTGAQFGKDTRGFKDAHGIADERRFYYQSSGLLQWRADRPMPSHRFADEGRKYAASKRENAEVHGSVGYRGLFAGPRTHIVDYYALADPLLARLPANYKPTWRIGHFTRHVPQNYVQSAATGTNQLTDPNLAAYYDKLLLVTRGPLWSAARWRAIVDLNLGRADKLIDVDFYRFPLLVRMKASDVATPKKAGLKANDRGLKKFRAPGIGVAFDAPQHATTLELSLLDHQAYRLLLMQGTTIAGDYLLPAEPKPKQRLIVREVDLPATLAAEGYTDVRLIPLNTKGDHVLGHLRPIGS